MTPAQKIFGLFHLKWIILVQIQLYFNRNVRQFIALTTTVSRIHVLLAAERVRLVEPVEPPRPRYGPLPCIANLRSCSFVTVTKLRDSLTGDLALATQYFY